MKKKQTHFIIIFTAITLFFSCNDKFADTIFKSQTPHQKYEQKLKDAGLEGSSLYNQWLNVAERSLVQPVTIDIPYLEMGYFAEESPEATGFIFDARNGERLLININLQSKDSTQLFVDLFELVADTSKQHRHLRSVDPGDTSVTFDVSEDGKYILRVQPELLASLSYELKITAEPSLENPVAQDSEHNIGSFFGDGREAGRRKHEGIDIFAARATPAVAAADGIISRVGTNNLGGKIVFLKPQGRAINLYYAHLDSQLVTNGQRVSIGDTVGLIGNTGNAITTPPHLHFGIYTPTGAVDPLPFIRPGKSNPSKIISNTKQLGDTVRVTSRNKNVAMNTPAKIEAAAQNGYRVILPDKSKMFIMQNEITTQLRPLKTITLDQSKQLLREPDISAVVISDYPAGNKLPVIGEYNGFYLIQQDQIQGWIKQ